MEQATVIIIGGGLAGLTAAIDLSRDQVPVILFEKREFPHHKVCGEYISKEVLPYFDALGLSLEELNPPELSVLKYSTARGNALEVPLPLGGLGISRYALDDFLFRKAVENGVDVRQETVSSVEYKNGGFRVETPGNIFGARVVLGAFGKRSSLDRTLERPFFKQPAPWLAFKSHYRNEGFPENQVGLHNFKGGYCGLSRTETGLVNVCYLVSYRSFRKHKDPEEFTEIVLRKNPFLDEFFSGAVPVFDKPLSIGQVSFRKKSVVEGHVLMLGDAAGLLHPLCGNGMAMAIHSAKIAVECVQMFLRGTSDQASLEKNYRVRWNKRFRSRLQAGRWLQHVLLDQRLSEASQSVLSRMPFLLPGIIKKTHGTSIL